MPGPKMGVRPPDFDERVVRMAPTFQKWVLLTDGQKLRYACRDFVKGRGEDEERLMRRIMIARRNNLRDHEMLKKARSKVRSTTSSDNHAPAPLSSNMDTDTTTAGDTTAPVDVTVNSAVDTEKAYTDLLNTTAANVDNEMLADDANNTNKRKEPPDITTTDQTATSVNEEEKISFYKEINRPSNTGEDAVAGQATFTATVPPAVVKQEDLTGGGLLGPLIRKRAKATNGMTDLEVKLEMDEAAVESTRSYKTWKALTDGMEFTYNQSYIKGKEGHDWLLKKNIWRRMRYRRENKEMVKKMKDRDYEDYLNKKEVEGILAATTDNDNPLHLHTTNHGNPSVSDIPSVIIKQEPNMNTTTPETPAANATAAAVAASSAPSDYHTVVEAAVAAALSYVKNNRLSTSSSDKTDDELVQLPPPTTAAVHETITAAVQETITTAAQEDSRNTLTVDTATELVPEVEFVKVGVSSITDVETKLV